MKILLFAFALSLLSLGEAASRSILSIDALDRDGWTAAHWAAYNGDLPALKELKRLGANLKKLNICESTILHMAVRGNGASCFDEILSCYPESFEVADIFGNLPVHYAVRLGKLEYVQLMRPHLTLQQLRHTNKAGEIPLQEVERILAAIYIPGVDMRERYQSIRSLLQSRLAELVVPPPGIRALMAAPPAPVAAALVPVVPPTMSASEVPVAPGEGGAEPVEDDEMLGEGMASSAAGESVLSPERREDKSKPIRIYGGQSLISKMLAFITSGPSSVVIPYDDPFGEIKSITVIKSIAESANLIININSVDHFFKSPNFSQKDWPKRLRAIKAESHKKAILYVIRGILGE